MFAATYKVFGDIVKAQYPDLLPTYPPVGEILDTSYLSRVAKRNNVGAADLMASTLTQPAKPNPSKPTRIISSKAWNITFQTGRAAFSPQATATLDSLIRDLLVAGNTVVEIHGHTDNVGNPGANMQLSEARAFAVKNWLEKRAPRNFPKGRLRVIAHGQTQPIEPNTTSQGRARNRRVEIKIGTAN